MLPRLFVVSCVLLAASAAAAEVTIVDNDKTLTIDCAKDKAVSLIGNHNTVTLIGTCSKVTVTGNHETVSGSATAFFVAGNHNTVRADVVDEIFLAGNKNTVTWRKSSRKPTPKITNPGKGNRVTQQK